MKVLSNQPEAARIILGASLAEGLQVPVELWTGGLIQYLSGIE